MSCQSNMILVTESPIDFLETELHWILNPPNAIIRLFLVQPNWMFNSGDSKLLCSNLCSSNLFVGKKFVKQILFRIQNKFRALMCLASNEIVRINSRQREIWCIQYFEFISAVHRTTLNPSLIQTDWEQTKWNVVSVSRCFFLPENEIQREHVLIYEISIQSHHPTVTSVSKLFCRGSENKFLPFENSFQLVAALRLSCHLCLHSDER